MLEANWQVIHRELTALSKDNLMPWIEKEFYNYGWDVFGLYVTEKKLEENCRLCPETTRLIESIPGMTSAGFSILQPGAHILPHVGYSSDVLRCHLGLSVPEDCALRVGTETRGWADGKCMVFDDTVEHEAWNRGGRQRAILLIDFKKEASAALSKTAADPRWARALGATLPATAKIETEICPHPVFIIGSPRSGTTGLNLALGQHSELWAHFESEIIMRLFDDGHLNQMFESARQRPLPTYLRMYGVDKPELLRSLGLGINALFTSKNPGKRWVDKTPAYALIADMLADMFPGAFFIHLLRDGRDAVHSMTNFLARFNGEQVDAMVRGGFASPWATDFREACRTWREFSGAAARFAAAHPERSLTVLNEQLVADPDAGFKRIFEFIGVPHEDGPAEFFKNYRVNSSFLKDAGAAAEQAGSNESGARRALESLGETQEWQQWAGRNVDLFLQRNERAAARPWHKWPVPQRRIFAEEAGPTLVAYGMATEAELQAWCEERESGGARSSPPEPVEPASTAPHEYQKLIEAIREIAARNIPAGACALVVSKGDDSLSNLDSAVGWHFPQSDDGVYLGYAPGTSEEAIAHLEALREKGASFFLLPNTAFWWLDHYAGFFEHLDGRYSRTWEDERCVIFQLMPASSPETVHDIDNLVSEQP